MDDDRNQWCFACGKLNPISLKLKFEEQGETYISYFTPGPEHQSYDGVVHGGIISTLLDEIMARYPYSKGLNTVTARLEVRFRHPTPIGQQLTVTSEVVRQRGKMFEMAGSVALSDGTVTAEGKATLVAIKEVGS